VACQPQIANKPSMIHDDGDIPVPLPNLERRVFFGRFVSETN
jgi:hypothetical protein